MGHCKAVIRSGGDYLIHEFHTFLWSEGTTLHADFVDFYVTQYFVAYSHFQYSIKSAVCHVVFVTWCLSRGVCHVVFVTWCLSRGVCHVVFVTWCLSRGVCHVVFVTWCLSRGVCHVVFVTWCLSRGVCHTVHAPCKGVVSRVLSRDMMQVIQRSN